MKSKYLMIGAAVCAALFLFSGVMLCRQYADEKQSAEAFEQIAALVETEPVPADTPQETEPLPELTAFEKYRAVQEQNSDFVGWLSIPGTNIDYPVMQTIGVVCMRYSTGFPAGAVLCKVWTSCESYTGISPTSGGSLKDGTMPLGVPLSRGIPPVISLPVSTLKNDGKKPVGIFAAVRFIRRCGKRSSGAERR